MAHQETGTRGPVVEEDVRQPAGVRAREETAGLADERGETPIRAHRRRIAVPSPCGGRRRRGRGGHDASVQAIEEEDVEVAVEVPGDQIAGEADEGDDATVRAE